MKSIIKILSLGSVLSSILFAGSFSSAQNTYQNYQLPAQRDDSLTESMQDQINGGGNTGGRTSYVISSGAVQTPVSAPLVTPVPAAIAAPAVIGIPLEPLAAPAAATALAPVALSMGTLTVQGEAGPNQLFAKIKAVRCDEPTQKVNAKTGIPEVQRSCDAPVFFDLNKVMPLPAGKYILGFENTLYPGFYDIQDGDAKIITLEKIVIPKSFAKESLVRIYRDFSALTEQKKIYMQMYYMGKHFFRLTNQYKFGDLYLADSSRLDVVQRINYSFCSQIHLYNPVREHSRFVCDSWNEAESMMDLTDLYRFNTDGTYQEAWANAPGDIVPIRHARHLVSAPLKPTEYVSVFPGVYQLRGESGSSRTLSKVTVGAATPENYTKLGRKFAQSSNKDYTEDSETEQVAAPGAVVPQPVMATEDAGAVAPLSQPGDFVAPVVLAAAVKNPKCDKATSWRTEFRTYCIKDSQEGCDRYQAKMCDEMKLDLRFRK